MKNTTCSWFCWSGSHIEVMRKWCKKIGIEIFDKWLIISLFCQSLSHIIVSDTHWNFHCKTLSIFIFWYFFSWKVWLHLSVCKLSVRYSDILLLKFTTSCLCTMNYSKIDYYQIVFTTLHSFKHVYMYA